MTKLMIPTLLMGLVLAACGRADEPEKVASMQAQIQTLEEDNKKLRAENDTLQEQRTDYDTRLRDVTGERDALTKKLRDLESAPAKAPEETNELKQRISALEAEIATLKEHAAAATTPEPTAETEPAETPAVDVEAVKQKMEELWPLVQAGDRKALGEMQDQLDGANKELRDTYIQQVKDWVKQEPNNKHARITLAAALSTRFQDLTDPMKMGALAGEMKQETEKALTIDPDYYEAQHFLCILRVNYPSFTQEFKEADKSLDRALELQAGMIWEDRFAEIYAAYGMWYRVQQKYDEAAAKVQAGLDLAPRHQGLLDEKQRIDDAIGTEEE
ncbi:MAG: hypothetical protein K8I27_15220 [Planctomycetes bacterium]|nr:hypothetical protein [Planctomycetota bacterium]